jgi:hypothetical protein
MPQFKKRILEVDTYHSPDGEVVVTPERLAHWAATFDTMNEGAKIPVAWDHSDDPKQASPIARKGRKRSAQNNVGELVSFAVTPDGQAADIVLDIPLEADAEKVENNLAEVSPVIFEKWVDGQKNEFTDCITHVDLVNHPVDASQTEFTQCGLRMGLDTGNPQTYRLAAEDSADGKTEETEGEGVPVMPERLTKVITALEGVGVILPDDTDSESFFDRLETALLTLAHAEENEVGTQELEPSPDVAALSLEGQEDPKDDSPEVKFITKSHQTAVMSRLSLLLEKGQCTPAEFEARQEPVGAIRLSLNDQGEHTPTSVESWIESRESVPEGTFWDGETRTRMSKLVVAKHPAGTTDEETEESAQENADAILGVKK